MVNDSNTRHLLRAERSNHKVIKKINEIGNGVLHYHRNGDCKSVLIKGSVADKAFKFHLVTSKIMSLYCITTKRQKQ